MPCTRQLGNSAGPITTLRKMALTIEELKERLASRFDEVTLLEILDVTADDIVLAFEDKIIDKQDKLREALEEDDSESTTEIEET